MANSVADFATTEREKSIFSMLDNNSQRAIARNLGIAPQTVSAAVSRVKRRAAKHGYSPDHDMTRPCPETHYVKGTSTLYDKDGGITQQWVKTNADQDRMADLARELVSAACEDVKPIKPTKQRKMAGIEDKHVVYPIGDAHVGLYCWDEDSEANWNCDIVERIMVDSFAKVLSGSPDSKGCLIANLGDWFHTDTPDNVTRRSGHALDVDTRWARVVRTGVRIIRTLIDSALQKHETVKVINEIGNHDDQSAIMLSAILAAAYEKESRVTIDESPDVYHWHEYGNNLFGVHHGHKAKPQQLYQVMAEDMREACARCEHRFWLTGHLHHLRMMDVGGQQIETFRTIIPRDNHAHSSGYRSKRSICSMTVDKQHGECQRCIVHVNNNS